MLTAGAFEKARLYIESHAKSDKIKKYEFYPCITVSRETGTGDSIICQKLIEFFNRKKITDSPEWTIFDRNLIAKVLADHHLPHYLQKFLEEDKYSEVTSLFTELLTGQPSAWTLINKEFQTIYNLARSGNVIIIGRGGNFITSKMKNSFHIRLIAPYESRIKNIEQQYNISRKEAEHFIKKDDDMRKHFIHDHFQHKLEEPAHYHLTINTGLVSHYEAAKIIGKAVVKRFRKAFKNKSDE